MATANLASLVRWRRWLVPLQSCVALPKRPPRSERDVVLPLSQQWRSATSELAREREARGKASARERERETERENAEGVALCLIALVCCSHRRMFGMLLGTLQQHKRELLNEEQEHKKRKELEDGACVVACAESFV